jgi:predicted nucleic acid-binding protein
MADYVVDTSIIMQRFIRDTYTEQTRRLFRNLIDGDKFYIPEFCLVECTNVLWKQVRFHEMPQAEAELLFTDLRELPFTIVTSEELLIRALQIGAEQKLAVYDPVYIALAEQYAYPLITADGKQEKAARAVGVTIKPITDF